VRHIAIFRDDLQPLNSFGVADNIIEEDWTIFFNPKYSYLSDFFNRATVITVAYVPWQLIIWRSPSCDGFNTVAGSTG
jgi:hypothetical protein